MTIRLGSIAGSYLGRELYPSLLGMEDAGKKAKVFYPRHTEEPGEVSGGPVGSSQVQVRDPYKLLDRYPHLKPVLEEIQKRIEQYDPNAREHHQRLDLSKIDFTGFNIVTDAEGFPLNLQNLLQAAGKGLQYPLEGAILKRADLSGAWAYEDGNHITGKALKEFLVKQRAVIDESTRF